MNTNTDRLTKAANEAVRTAARGRATIPMPRGEVQDDPWKELRRRWAAGSQSGVAAAGRSEERSVAVAGITYLVGLGELTDDPEALASLRVGARLGLRRDPALERRGAAGGWCRRIEVYAPKGRGVGYLPTDDARAVAELLDTGAPVTARVTALVPAFQRTRVQLVIEVGQAAASAPGPAHLLAGKRVTPRAER